VLALGTTLALFLVAPSRTRVAPPGAAVAEESEESGEGRSALLERILRLERELDGLRLDLGQARVELDGLRTERRPL
jgi:hypothetical protein